MCTPPGSPSVCTAPVLTGRSDVMNTTPVRRSYDVPWVELFQFLGQFGPTTRISVPAGAFGLFSGTMSETKTSIDRASLAAQIAEVSLLRGTFTLRSGNTSSYYLDKYRFSTKPAILTQLGELFACVIREIESEIGEVQQLAGAELGGIPLVTAASMATGKPSIFVRNEKKGYGTSQQVEGVIHNGDRVLFVEDVATTGGQSVEAIKVLRAAGADVRGVICVIDRLDGARRNIEKTGVRFDSLFTKTDLGVED